MEYNIQNQGLGGENVDTSTAVCNHWTGLHDWTTGLDYWTDV